MRTVSCGHARSEHIYVVDHSGACGYCSGKQQTTGTISTGLRRIRAEYDTTEPEQFPGVDKILPPDDSTAAAGGDCRVVFAVRSTKLNRRRDSSALEHRARGFCHID